MIIYNYLVMTGLKKFGILQCKLNDKNLRPYKAEVLRLGLVYIYPIARLDNSPRR